METARAMSFPSCQLRGPVAPGHDVLSSPDETSFTIPNIRTSWRWKQRSPGSITPRTVWKSQPHWLVTVSWSLIAGRVVVLANTEVPPNQERTRSHPQVRNPTICLRLQQPGSRDEDSPCLYRPSGYGNPNPADWLLSHTEIPREEGCPSVQLRHSAGLG